MGTMDEMWSVLKQAIAALDALGIRYMIVGSTAMWAYMPGRTTFDTDLLVDMSEDQLAQLVDELGEDWMLQWEVARDALRAGKMFNAIHYGSSWKLDFVPLKDDPFHAAEFERRRRGQIGALECTVQTPEDLVISKLLCARRGGSARQLEDVRALFRDVEQLDREYIGKWASELGLDALLEETQSG